MDVHSCRDWDGGRHYPTYCTVNWVAPNCLVLCLILNYASNMIQPTDLHSAIPQGRRHHDENWDEEIVTRTGNEAYPEDSSSRLGMWGHQHAVAATTRCPAGSSVCYCQPAARFHFRGGVVCKLLASFPGHTTMHSKSSLHHHRNPFHPLTRPCGLSEFLNGLTHNLRLGWSLQHLGSHYMPQRSPNSSSPHEVHPLNPIMRDINGILS